MSDPYIKVAAGDIIKSSDWNGIQVQIRNDLARLDQKIDSISAALAQKLERLDENCQKLGQRAEELNTSLSSRIDALRGSLSVSLQTASLTVSGTVTANRHAGVNSLVLDDFATVDPGSNVYLDSPPNDRDAWIYRDSADHGSNWGIYHRQIDKPLRALPENSIAFVGGGRSALQAYVNLENGDGRFFGRLTVASLAIGSWTFTEEGNHLYLRRGQQIIARFSIEADRLQLYKNLDGKSPYYYYNQENILGPKLL
jgi:hypothetical protein